MLLVVMLLVPKNHLLYWQLKKVKTEPSRADGVVVDSCSFLAVEFAVPCKNVMQGARCIG